MLAILAIVSLYVALLAIRHQNAVVRWVGLLPVFVAFMSISVIFLQWIGVDARVDYSELAVKIPMYNFIVATRRTPWWISSLLLVGGLSLNYYGEQRNNTAALIVSYTAIAASVCIFVSRFIEL